MSTNINEPLIAHFAPGHRLDDAKLSDLFQILNTWLKEERCRDGIDAFLQNYRILITFAKRIHLNTRQKKKTGKMK